LKRSTLTVVSLLELADGLSLQKQELHFHDIFYLLCLQAEHPKNIHLIRGNHEAPDINALFGFRIECIERMVSIYLQ
jgi:protein phosphatase